MADIIIKSGVGVKKIVLGNSEVKMIMEILNAEAQAREAKDAELQDKITAEASTREAKDAELQDKITAEAQARETKDTELQSGVDYARTNIHVNSQAIVELMSDLGSEERTREAQDAELQDKITAEASTREAKDAELDEKIAQETQTRELTYYGLQTLIGEEETARITADTTLDGKITAEASARETADSELQDKINEIKDKTLKTITFKNLLNVNDENYEVGKYVNPNTGKTANNTGYNTTGYISVDTGDTICLSVRNSMPSSGATYRTILPIVWMAFYDDNKAVVKNDLKTTSEKAYWYIPEGVKYVRISFSPSDLSNNELMVEKITQIGISDAYIEYGNEKTVEISLDLSGIDMYLPPYIYAVKNREFDIYTPAMFGDVEPRNNIKRIGYTASGFGTTNFAKRFIRITPTGTAGLTIHLKGLSNGNSEIASAFTKIVTKNPTTATKTILAIGDSLTDGKPWIAEIMRLNPNYTFVGSYTATKNDSEGNSHTFKHDGRSGWRAEQYYTGYNPSVNNFWDGSSFNFSYYVTNVLGGTAPDIVNIFLGMNDMERDLDSAVNYEKLIVDNIRSYYPNMPIIICAPQARDYNKESNVSKNGYLMMKKLYETFSAYQKLYFVPLYLLHDSENNYKIPDEYESVNPRSSIMTNKISDTVHPQDAGYWQIADAIFAALCAIN